MDVVRTGNLTPALQAAIVLVVLAFLGCRTDPAITALERENRDLEDEIYALQDLLDRTQDELDACRRGKGGAAEPARTPLEDRGPTTPRAEPTPVPTPERVPLPTPRGLNSGPGTTSARPSRPGHPALPKIELPAEPLPEGQVPATLRGAAPPK